jgi:hypothetical protein
VSRIVGSITSRGETTHNKTQKSIIFLFHILRFWPIKKKESIKFVSTLRLYL